MLGFQAKVIAYDPYVSAEEVAARHATKVTFDELLAQSAIITLHCPLTKETSRMLCAPQLAAMNPGTILVNTCRGEIFNQADLIAALESGVGGYATDVVEGGSIGGDHVLLIHKERHRHAAFGRPFGCPAGGYGADDGRRHAPRVRREGFSWRHRQYGD